MSHQDPGTPVVAKTVADLMAYLSDCAGDTRIAPDPLVLWQADGALLIDFTGPEDDDEGAADQ